jgi:hypothetical protein
LLQRNTAVQYSSRTEQGSPANRLTYIGISIMELVFIAFFGSLVLIAAMVVKGDI